MADNCVLGRSMTVNKIDDRKRYRIQDALEALQDYSNDAALVFLDDAWARPQRRQQFGVEYDTHPFDESQEDIDDHVDTSLTTTEILDACYEALAEGGWLIADADDWLMPRMIRYLQAEWGDAAATYEGGGYRKTGGVTYLKSDGTPDRSTAGMYLSTGGYPVVFAHKGETDRMSSVSARQLADRPQERYDWGSVKPISPYVSWVEALAEPDELILVPCAGTAPAAIAAEKVFDNQARYVCVDNEEEAHNAFRRRRKAELSTKQQTLE